MTKEEARAKVTGLIREATEFSVLATQLFTLCRASDEDANELLPPLAKLFAKGCQLTETEAWTLLEGVTAHLAEEPFAYFVLAPPQHKSDGDIGRYLEVQPASNRQLELALERGLETHSFDTKEEK
jgi:hypothetical protein